MQFLSLATRCEVHVPFSCILIPFISLSDFHLFCLYSCFARPPYNRDSFFSVSTSGWYRKLAVSMAAEFPYLYKDVGLHRFIVRFIAIYGMVQNACVLFCQDIKPFKNATSFSSFFSIFI